MKSFSLADPGIKLRFIVGPFRLHFPAVFGHGADRVITSHDFIERERGAKKKKKGKLEPSRSRGGRI
jgi:hypothetical protein